MTDLKKHKCPICNKVEQGRLDSFHSEECAEAYKVVLSLVTKDVKTFAEFKKTLEEMAKSWEPYKDFK